MTNLSWKRTPFLERLFAGQHDVLAALRSLRRSPGFVAIAVISLGLAVGLNTTTFAMLDAIRHPYVPYKNPSELYQIGVVSWGRDPLVSVREMYSALTARHDLYTDLVPTVTKAQVVEGSVGLRTAIVRYVGARYFDVLGVQPIVGRVFHAQANGTPDASGAVISSDLWHDQFGGETHLERLTMTVGGTSRRIIGVMPATFGIYGSVWIPMPTDSALTFEGTRIIWTIARLRPDKPAPLVKAQLDQISKRFAADKHDTRGLFDYRVESMNPEPGQLKSFDVAMGGASLLVLLVACFNLANLMLARGLARRREVAVRLAVGASPGAIMRYVLTECGILAILGGGWGLLASMWGVKAAERYMPRQVANFGFVAPHLTWRVVAFGIFAVTATVFLVGVIPALRASRTDVNDAMKDGGSSSTGRTTRSQYVLAVAEVALSLVVMMAAGLLIRAAYAAANDRDWGYDVAHVLEASTLPSAQACSTSVTRNYLGELATHVESAPNVEYATAYAGGGLAGRMLTSDMPGTPIEVVALGFTVATPDYFRASGILIREGRDFLPGDAQGTGVAIIDRKTAAQLWPLQSPVGRLLKLGASKTNAPWVRVVGVSGSVNDLSDPNAKAASFDPVVVWPTKCGGANVRVRVKGTSGKTPIGIFHALVAAVPAGRVSAVTSPTSGYESIVASRRLIAIMFSMIGLFALALTAIGVYGILSYTVSQRMREFAMRIALGAQNGDLFEIVWHDALVMVLAGTGIGAFGALAFGPLLGEYWLNHVLPTDVWSLIGAEAVLLLVGLAACIGPVRRAMRADPVELMRAL